MFLRRMILVLTFLVVTCLTVNNGLAADVKIGIMNVKKIVALCDAGQQARVRFEEKVNTLKTSFQKEGEALKGMKDEIDKKSSAWSKETYTEKQQEYNSSRRKLKIREEDASLELKNLQEKELAPILKALEKIVPKFAKDNGYTAIMDSMAGVIYFDEKIDISDVLVEKLNEVLAKK